MAAGAHSLRQDASSKRRLRDRANPGAGIAFSTRAADGISTHDFAGMRDVVAAYDAHKARRDIRETKQSGIGFHAVISVSPEWVIEDGGDLHDPKNPRNLRMLREALRWLESWCGKDSVYCIRMDLDEEGGGVVDAFVMPAKIDKRSDRLTISTSKVLTAIRKKHSERMSYVALQTDWAKHCQSFLDHSIKRGTRKVDTRAEHLEMEEFKQASSKAARRLAQKAEELQILIEKMQKLELTAQERAELGLVQEELRNSVPKLGP